MSRTPHRNSHEPEAEGGEGGHGCGKALLILAGLLVVAGLSLYLYMSYQERAAMRQNLQGMGVGRWSDHCTNVKTLAVFSGSDTLYYKLAIPPPEVPQFLAALQASGFKGPPTVVRGESPGGVKIFPGLIRIGDHWWRPQDEKELLRVEQGVWYAAASTETGHVYICKVGH